MQTPILTKNFESDGAISPYRIVAHGSSDGNVAQGAADTDALCGVTGQVGTDAAGERVDANMAGVAFVEYGGNVTRGDPLTTDASGRAITATAHTHTENTASAYTQNATTSSAANVRIIGYAVVSGVLGDIGSVQITPGQA